MNKVIRYIKRNFVACLCFLLATAVALTGSLSYARYVSGGGEEGDAASGSFAYSTKIDAVSALSFTNTAFWGGAIGGEEDDKIAMNALRAIDFSVNNFETLGGKPSEVALGYTLSFSAPANFVEKLAIQLFDEDAGTAMLPQIVMADLLATPSGGSFNTADSEDYNGDACTELAFTVQTSGTLTVASSSGVRIKIERDTVNLRQALLFRLWNTEGLGQSVVERESGLLLPPMEAKLNVDAAIYRVSISMDALRLNPGTPHTRRHSLRLAPTNTLNDNYLGGTIYAADGSALTSIHAGGNYLLRTVKERVADNGVAGPQYTVIGRPTVYHVDTPVTSDTVPGFYTETLTEAHEYTNSTTTTYGAVYEELGWAAAPQQRLFNSSWNYTTSNYSAEYRLTINSTSEVTVTETVRIAPGAAMQVETGTYETATPTSVTETEIRFNVVRTTERYAAYSGTVTVTRTYTVTGYTLEVNNGYFFRPSWETYSGAYEGDASYIPTKTVTENLTEYGPVTLDPVNEPFERILARTIVDTPFTPNSVTRTDGEDVTYDYTSTNPFELKNGSGIQIFYASQCYSKTYPFDVDVIFEQITQ